MSSETPTASPRSADRVAPERHNGRERKAVALTLGGIVVLAFLVRIWGIKSGLPFVYNVDEGAHFVPSAVGFFGFHYKPTYFQNPPALSYLIHFVLAFYYGGPIPLGVGDHVKSLLRTDPTGIFTVGRVTVAVLGSATVAAAYFAGRRFYGRGAGLVAAALMAFTFMPVFYAHFALNDVATTLPLTVCLFAIAGIHLRGKRFDYILAGAMLGIATATKYTAAALLVPIVVAGIYKIRAGERTWREELRFQLWGALGAIVAFIAVNPFSVIDLRFFLGSLRRQQHYSSDVDKLGLDHETGWQYYIWTATFGFGWLPLAAAVGGAIAALRNDWRKAFLLISFIGAFWLVMGSQHRFYARWLLPVYPFLAVLAGYGVYRIAQLAPQKWRIAVGVVATGVILIQPVLSVIHNDRVLARPDTRDQARVWLQQHLLPGERVVFDRVVPANYFYVGSNLDAPLRWYAYPRSPGLIEDYVGTLNPLLLQKYARGNFCIVVTGSIQSGRAFKEPKKSAGAIAYYNALNNPAIATKLATFSPVKQGTKLPAFNFDTSYDYYPGNYVYPGPRLNIYKLNIDRCRNYFPLRTSGIWPGTANAKASG